MTDNLTIKIHPDGPRKECDFKGWNARATEIIEKYSSFEAQQKYRRKYKNHEDFHEHNGMLLDKDELDLFKKYNIGAINGK